MLSEVRSCIRQTTTPPCGVSGRSMVSRRRFREDKFERRRDGLHLGIDPNPGPGATCPRQMNVYVPDFCGVQAFPGGRDQLVIGQMFWYRQRKAWIPQTLPRPELPTSDAGTDSRGCKQKSPSSHLFFIGSDRLVNVRTYLLNSASLSNHDLGVIIHLAGLKWVRTRQCEQQRLTQPPCQTTNANRPMTRAAITCHWESSACNQLRGGFGVLCFLAPALRFARLRYLLLPS